MTSDSLRMHDWGESRRVFRNNASRVARALLMVILSNRKRPWDDGRCDPIGYCYRSVSRSGR